MELIYDSEDRDFSIELEDDYKIDNFVSYVIPTENPVADFSKCLKIAEEFTLLHQKLTQFLYAQVETVPQNLIHQCIYDLMMEHKETLDTVAVQPLDNPNDPDEAEGKAMYLEMLNSEVKHLKKYLKSSQETLKLKLCLGSIEIVGQDCTARFYLEHVLDPVLILTFRLEQVVVQPEAVVEKPLIANNVITMPIKKRPE